MCCYSRCPLKMWCCICQELITQVQRALRHGAQLAAMGPIGLKLTQAIDSLISSSLVWASSLLPSFRHTNHSVAPGKMSLQDCYTRLFIAYQNPMVRTSLQMGENSYNPRLLLFKALL